MDECPNMNRCSFFLAYASSGEHVAAVAGFVRLYCRGEGQQRCVRKKVSNEVGGPDKVPSNMLPNGVPVAGTDASSWSEEVLRAVKS